MKKIIVILLAVVLVALPSCKNQNKQTNAEQEAPEYTPGSEQVLSDELKVNMSNLLLSIKKVNPVLPMLEENQNKVELTAQEKMVKPDFLFDPNNTANMVTLTQKYRLIGILSVDKIIAQLYDMPVTDYNNTIAKLVAEVNDPALKEYIDCVNSGTTTADEEMNNFVSAAYTSGRASLYWEGFSSTLVECLYVTTRDLDKFMPMFDDQSVSDITFNIICVHENITALIDYYPEMESLNEILGPLYVLNAITVDQFKSQLLEIKDEIAEIRAQLIK